MKVLKNSAGLFYKEGQGFKATSAADATQLSVEDALEKITCAVTMGEQGVIAVCAGSGTDVTPPKVHKSFAVYYVRPDDDDGDGGVLGNDKNPSRRRFATVQEANTHGARFSVRKASYGAAPGSAGHIGFYVKETTDPVNSVVNPKTGLTNPAPGFPRTFAARQAAGTTVAQLAAKRSAELSE